MKKLNKFFTETSLWVVFFIMFGFSSVIWYSLFQFIEEMTTPILYKLSLGLGFVFGFMVTALLSEMRKNDEFWQYLKELEMVIENTNTKQGLTNIVNNELISLTKLSQGPTHWAEIKRLRSVIATKSKYIN